MDRLRDQAQVATQYADTGYLSLRAASWTPEPGRPTPQQRALWALSDSNAGAVLEIGCGTGSFALEIQRMVGAHVVASDASTAMVAATKDRGVTALAARAEALPLPDDTVDAVCAMWMLYHVPDLAATLAEVRRVLRPGGVFVAATNSERHTVDLRAAAGLAPARTQFTSENGQASLSAQFAHVTRHDHRSTMRANHARAVAYVASFDPEAAARVEHFGGVREFTGAGSVFVAR